MIWHDGVHCADGSLIGQIMMWHDGVRCADGSLIRTKHDGVHCVDGSPMKEAVVVAEMVHGMLKEAVVCCCCYKDGARHAEGSCCVLLQRWCTAC